MQSSFPDAGSGHCHIGDDGAYFALVKLLVQGGDGIVVDPQDVLHVEIGGRMDSVEQGPLLIEGDFFILQFFLYRAETANHDVLADTDILVHLDLAVVATRCDEFVACDV